MPPTDATHDQPRGGKLGKHNPGEHSPLANDLVLARKGGRRARGGQRCATAAGLKVDDLRSRIDDPPDCEATINRQRCGIEVTELLHQTMLQRALKAIKKRLLGQVPTKPEAYFVWNKETFLAKLEEIIRRKDEKAAGMKGGPYARYILVIVTAETFLHRGAVQEFLLGKSFLATHITDAFLGLDYHPDPEGGSGSYPTFTLQLVRGTCEFRSGRQRAATRGEAAGEGASTRAGAGHFRRRVPSVYGLWW
jgi:hypothetical protein